MRSKRSIKLNHERNARKRLMFHLKNVLKKDIKGMTINEGIKIFINHYEIKVIGGLKDWLYTTYENKSNEILSHRVSYGKKRKIKDDSYLGKLANKSRKFKRYSGFLQSKYWHEVRLLVLKRDGYKCRVCPSTENLQVHHDSYKNHFNEHNHLDDLMTLCRVCHEDYHFNIANSNNTPHLHIPQTIPD